MNESAYRTCLFCGVEVREKNTKRGKTWALANPGGFSPRVLCEGSPNGLHHPDLGAESGHTFRVSVISRGSYGVEGVEGHTDAEDFAGSMMTLDVRAWNLPDALRRASQRPLWAWFDSEEAAPAIGASDE